MRIIHSNCFEVIEQLSANSLEEVVGVLGVERLDTVIDSVGMVDEVFGKDGSFATAWRTNEGEVAAIASPKKIA